MSALLTSRHLYSILFVSFKIFSLVFRIKVCYWKTEWKERCGRSRENSNRYNRSLELMKQSLVKMRSFSKVQLQLESGFEEPPHTKTYPGFGVTAVTFLLSDHFLTMVKQTNTKENISSIKTWGLKKGLDFCSKFCFQTKLNSAF